MKSVLFCVTFLFCLSAFALGDYYSAKIDGKEYHLFIGTSGSYLYRVGDNQAYFLRKEVLLGTIKTFEVFDSSHRDKPVGQIRISDRMLEVFEINGIKSKNVKLKKLKLPIEQIILRQQIYNNDKCSFKFVDLNDVKNAYLFKEVSFLISEVMDSFKQYNCDYLQSNRSKEIDSNLNQLACENETILLKNRFYGVTFSCKASLAKSSDFKFRAFSVIFDKSLKARVAATDFTDSDIADEDDYRDFMFRLTPVGLGLYSSSLVENRVEYVKIIPYIDLKKHFSKWGKPKRYLNYFIVK